MNDAHDQYYCPECKCKVNDIVCPICGEICRDNSEPADDDAATYPSKAIEDADVMGSDDDEMEGMTMVDDAPVKEEI